MGLEVESPSATFYVWSSIPSGYTSQEFCLKVLEEANVWMIPGSMYGNYGEGYFRIALTIGIERIGEAIERIKKIF